MKVTYLTGIRVKARMFVDKHHFLLSSYKLNGMTDFRQANASAIFASQSRTLENLLTEVVWTPRALQCFLLVVSKLLNTIRLKISTESHGLAVSICTMYIVHVS